MASDLATSILTGVFALGGGLGGVLLSNHLGQRAEKGRLAIEDARQLLADRRRVYAAYLGLTASMLEEIDRIALFLPDDRTQHISAKHESKISEGSIEYYGHWGNQLQPALAEVQLVAAPKTAELAERLSIGLLRMGSLIDSRQPFPNYYPGYFQTLDLLQVVRNAMRAELGHPEAVTRPYPPAEDWPWLPDRPSRESYARGGITKRRQPPA
jgi:hypothetical protein